MSPSTPVPQDQPDEIEPVDAEIATPLEVVPAGVDDSPAYDAAAITVLEGLEAVRKRPGMYIGSTGERGLHHLVYEIVDNSVDEALAGHCDTHRRHTAGRRRRPGRGQRPRHPDRHPPDRGRSSAVELVLTQLHAGGKFGGGGYKVSGGLHGVGSSVVNALSVRLEVRSGRRATPSGWPSRTASPVSPLEKRRPPTRPAPPSRSGPTTRSSRPTNYDFETLAGAVPADGVPQQGPDHHPRRRAGRADHRHGRRADVDLDAIDDDIADVEDSEDLTATGGKKTQGQEGLLPLRRRARRLRQLPRQEQEVRPGQPRRHLHRGRGRGQSRSPWSWRCSGRPPTASRSTPTPTRSTPTRAAPTRRGSGRR